VIPVVNLDSSGVVGIVGIIATVATHMVTRRYDLRVFEKRIEVERQNSRVQFERDLVREHHRLKLDAYTTFLGAEARYFLAILRGSSWKDLGPVMAEASEGLVRVRLVSSRSLQEKASAFWTATSDVLSTYERSRQLPTETAAAAAMGPKLEAHGEALRMLEATIMIELEDTLRDSEPSKKASSPSNTTE
jgi:hypothetical protein